MNDKNENSQWDTIIQALRDEAREYGGLLNILDDQQNKILGRNSEDLLGLNGDIYKQLNTNTSARKTRENAVQEIATELKLQNVSSLKELSDYIPNNLQGLIWALVDEVLSLSKRMHRKAGQNQMLLLRTTQASEEFIKHLLPETASKTYDKKGSTGIRAPIHSHKIHAAV